MFFSMGCISWASLVSWELLLGGPWNEGERSEPSGTARQGAGVARLSVSRDGLPLPIVSPCFWPFLLLSLLRQGSQTAAACAGGDGGVCELDEPLNGLWPVQVTAGAAHAQCSKLEPLLELGLRPQARMHKNEFRSRLPARHHTNP